MKHLIATLVLLFGVTLCVRAGDDAKAKKEGPGDKKPDAPKKADVDPGEPGEDAKKDENKTKEIFARLVKNVQRSEELLAKKDPGDITRQIQRDIVKDLDALIEQAKNQQNQGGGGAAQANQQQQQQQKQNPNGGQNQQPKDQNQQPQDQGGECKKGECKSGGGSAKPGEGKDGGQGSNGPGANPQPGGAQQQPAGGQPQAGQAKGGGQKEDRPMPAALGQKQDDKGGDKPQAGGSKGNGKDNKDGKNNGSDQIGRAKDHNPAIRNDLSDLFREVWGHLPEMRRQEMDAYQRERFMQRYDELLRQYYRTLSEQNRKRDD